MIWFLTLLTVSGEPILGGEYQSKARCEAAAQVQVVALKREYGRLKWRCEQTAPR